MLLKCNKCNLYQLREKCLECNEKTSSPHPAKFSIHDKYGKYRRIAKRNNK